MQRAKVFISSGQQINEKDVGLKVSSFLRERGFEPYFAEQFHTPEALTENIFNALRLSEYCIVINTHRIGGETGSLFIQQELAIASFLKIPTLLFHNGDISREGITKYLLLNPIKVHTIEDILEKLPDLIKNWSPNSKNQLFLSCGNHHLGFEFKGYHKLDFPVTFEKKVYSDWYHIIVSNGSSCVNARNCYGYIESILDQGTGNLIFKDDNYKTELIWAGTSDIDVNIPVKGKRDLDAFFRIRGINEIRFHQRSSSTSYRYNNLGEGTYTIRYIIISDNLPIAKIDVVVKVAEEILILDFKQIE